MRADLWYFLRVNLEHYALALFGLRLRFDPPYRHVTRLFPQYLCEPVFEYRTYGAHAVWAMMLAGILPPEALTALVVLWAAISWDRSKYLKSSLVFWRQVLRENGVSHSRAHGRYIEQLIREMERRMKAGEDWQECATEAARLQDDVIRHAGSKDAARAILAGDRPH